MNIQSLVREKTIGHIKIGTKSEKGLPKKLPFFNVEEDKATSIEMVNIFKQMYPGQPKVLKIRFTNEDPFSFRFKRYVNNKAVCIGNDEKAITVGKNAKGYAEQIEVVCSKECEHRLTGKCKLNGSLNFVLDGIEAGGVWRINTTGGLSLSNIASEIVKYKKAGMSIVNVPFELRLEPQESLAYGTYYSLDLIRTDIKPQITGEIPEQPAQIQEAATKQITDSETKKIASSTKTETKETKTKTVAKQEKQKESQKIEEQPKQATNELPKTENIEQQPKEDYSDIFYVVEISDTLIQNKQFKKIILQDINSQDNEYILHPKASQDILKYSPGTMIRLIKSEIQVGKNIICLYEIKQAVQEDGTTKEFNNELKEAV